MSLQFDFSDLETKLSELDKKISKQITDDALKKAGAVILEEQIKEVPKDTHKLEESLLVGKIKGTGTKKKIVIGINPLDYKRLTYGFYQEYGTQNFVGKKWMKRSWQKTKGKANKTIILEIQRGLGVND